MGIRCGNGAAHYHESIREVKECHARKYAAQGRPMRGMEENPANSFAHGTAHVERQTFAEPTGKRETFERTDIPGLGNGTLPKRPAFDPETLEDGFYALPDSENESLPAVYKVIVAVHGSGRKYAKQLNTDTGEWDMARGAIRRLRPEHKMTLAQALEVAKAVSSNPESRLYGRCFKCGLPLTKEESIGRMMGDICAGKFT
jgi:uncharacterized protein DUF6011